jgi:hypothetical protein
MARSCASSADPAGASCLDVPGANRASASRKSREAEAPPTEVALEIASADATASP